VPAWLVDLFARYGYAVVFVGVFLENTGVPVPGETILLAGAALAQFGRLSLGWVIAAAVAGAILGDNFGFFIGRHGGRALAERYGPRLGLSDRRLAEFDRFFAVHGARTVFAARFITGLRVVGAILAGASDLPWRTFLFYNATGAVVWSVAVSVTGYLLAYSWDTLERLIGGFGLAAFALFVAAVVVGVLRARRRHGTREAP
jgi:membrane protein DedA with SNARE-associated domain